MHISSLLIPIANGVIYHHTMAKIRDAKWYEELMFYWKHTHIEYRLLNTFRMWKEKQFEVVLARAMATQNATEICDEIIYCDLLLTWVSFHCIQ